jgi:hypothetical protein
MDKVCMTYCPGGTNYPVAKFNFFPQGVMRTTEYGIATMPYRAPHPEGGKPVRLFKFVVALCNPPQACLGGITCGRGYEGVSCSRCQIKYFRDKRK